MIKKLFGLCAAAAIVALLVVTVWHRDRYRSLLDVVPADEPGVGAPAPRPAFDPASDPALPADSLSLTAAPADGVR